MAIPNLPDLSKRVALVVGASHGVGRGIAQGLTEAGASIELVGRVKEKFFTLFVKRVVVLRPCNVRGCCSKRVAQRHIFARSYTNLSSYRGKAVSFCPVLMLLVTS
jgi:NAD(P)-dependent dehydrogenase (short-subunit alcohol dehydrogenase family)